MQKQISKDQIIKYIRILKVGGQTLRVGTKKWVIVRLVSRSWHLSLSAKWGRT